VQGILDQLKSTVTNNWETMKLKEPPTTFTRFASFPAEIRAKIWQHAGQISQLIDIEDEPGRHFTGNNSRCPLLLVNWEAEIEGLEHKEDLNGGYLEEEKMFEDHAHPAIFANPNPDIIWLK
jgi:hypothetical protein